MNLSIKSDHNSLLIAEIGKATVKKMRREYYEQAILKGRIVMWVHVTIPRVLVGSSCRYRTVKAASPIGCSNGVGMALTDIDIKYPAPTATVMPMSIVKSP